MPRELSEQVVVLSGAPIAAGALALGAAALLGRRMARPRLSPLGPRISDAAGDSKRSLM